MGVDIFWNSTLQTHHSQLLSSFFPFHYQNTYLLLLFIFIVILLVYLSDESFIVVFDQDDPNLQVAIKSCKNPESREKFLEEACKYFQCMNNQ